MSIRTEPQGQNTQIAKSIRAVLDDLQGQRLAGVIILTDGRDTPAQSLAATLSQLSDSGANTAEAHHVFAAGGFIDGGAAMGNQYNDDGGNQGYDLFNFG